MSDPTSFRTRTLSESGAMEFLSGRNIGRLAYVEGGRIEVRPVGYVRSGEWIFGRMGGGGKTEALLRNRWVTFQVDEVRDHWTWQSVVLHGALHFLDGTGGSAAEEARDRALAALRSAVPGLGGPGDPGSFRDMIFGIEIQEISGVEGYLEGA
jgi:nitroimidazol reductase NimA-like FMN-containing flavoprotein (pyridoxamine 5'-phosphate oxidase superfamily)